MQPRLSYTWLQQLAGILPLSALIEFIDVPTKLHLFELSGSVCLWNWPITPVGARLLLSASDEDQSCCLDQPGRSAALCCIDGRHGDFYPSSAPTTVRLCVASEKIVTVVPNSSKNLEDHTARRQTLDVIVLRRTSQGSVQRTTGCFGKWHMSSSPRMYVILSALGWCLWTIGLATSIAFHLYISAAYFALMPLTGMILSYTHGSQPRRLRDDRSSPLPRLIVAADSLNASRWTVFLGGSSILNSLLNKPLYRPVSNSTSPTSTHILHMLLRASISAQWLLAVLSCAFQDWNALLISFWITLCILADSHGYPPGRNVKDWLRTHSRITLERLVAKFSTRRSMLTALVYLNPDTRDGDRKRTNWMDPILTPGSPERLEWENALLALLSVGEDSPDLNCEEFRDKYWWNYIEEGLEMGRKIECAIQACSKSKV